MLLENVWIITSIADQRHRRAHFALRSKIDKDLSGRCFTPFAARDT